MSRREFSVSVKKAAFKRSGNRCECGCRRPFTDHPKERPEYDHILPDMLDGKPDLENCMVMRIDCHQTKTSTEDMPRFAKVRRGEKARKNITRIKQVIPGSRASKFKRKISGGTVLR